MTKLAKLGGAFALAVGLMAAPLAVADTVELQSTPVVIGQSFALPSTVMAGDREINVWLPPSYGEGDARYPVVYLMDGGQAQDFHHISGLTQLGTIVGTTQDVILVGVASMDRRNELAFRATGDATLAADYPTHGQSDRFRRFLAEEVKPFVEGRYRTSGDDAVLGESLAALFVVETFLKQPALFDRYLAISPSLWWDAQSLAKAAPELLAAQPAGARTLMLTIADEGGEMQAGMDQLVSALRQAPPQGLDWRYEPHPEQNHATIYHGAALDFLRAAYPPAPTE